MRGHVTRAGVGVVAVGFTILCSPVFLVVGCCTGTHRVVSIVFSHVVVVVGKSIGVVTGYLACIASWLAHIFCCTDVFHVGGSLEGGARRSICPGSLCTSAGVWASWDGWSHREAWEIVTTVSPPLWRKRPNPWGLLRQELAGVGVGGGLLLSMTSGSMHVHTAHCHKLTG